MKSVSGSFGMVVYNTHKHIRAKESFDVWPLHHQMWHCSSTSFQAKGLVPASLSFCSTFQSTKSNLAEDSLNNSRATHIKFHNTQWDHLSVPSCSGECTQPSTSCILCWELLADLRRLALLAVTDSSNLGQIPAQKHATETSPQQIFKYRSSAQWRFLWRSSYLTPSPYNTFPFPPNTAWDFSYLTTLKLSWFLVCLF